MENCRDIYISSCPREKRNCRASNCLQLPDQTGANIGLVFNLVHPAALYPATIRVWPNQEGWRARVVYAHSRGCVAVIGWLCFSLGRLRIRERGDATDVWSRINFGGVCYVLRDLYLRCIERSVKGRKLYINCLPLVNVLNVMNYNNSHALVNIIS